MEKRILEAKIQEAKLVEKKGGVWWDAEVLIVTDRFNYDLNYRIGPLTALINALELANVSQLKGTVVRI